MAHRKSEPSPNVMGFACQGRSAMRGVRSRGQASACRHGLPGVHSALVQSLELVKQLVFLLPEDNDTFTKTSLGLKAKLWLTSPNYMSVD